MVNRKELFKTAETLGIKFPKNIASTKLTELVMEKIEAMNSVLKPNTTTDSKEKVYCGKNPLTGEKIYK